jgi:hypothetical protein
MFSGIVLIDLSGLFLPPRSTADTKKPAADLAAVGYKSFRSTLTFHFPVR